MKPLIVANWKCNPPNLAEAREILSKVKEGIKDIKRIEIVICPPFIYLPYWVEFFRKRERKIKLGAQNCFWEEKGPFTGEISPRMLKDRGCQYVIIGHSERRALGETDEMINKKIKAVLKTKLKPILCIGETLKERKEAKTFQILKKKLTRALKNISNIEHRTSNIIVAYEPVWAIGTGNPCQPKDAKGVLLFLRKILKKNPILYGGSVNFENALDYIEKAKFDGLLIGGVSLKTKEFIKIAKTIDLFLKFGKII